MILGIYGSVTIAAASLYSTVEGVLQTWTLANTVLLLLTFLTLVAYFWLMRYWTWSFERMRDESSPLPLPPGSMGCPFIGETLELSRKGKEFYSWRLARYGNVYKTHVLGSPVVRLVGAENIRPVLMGEHVIVQSNWPWSVRHLLGSQALSVVCGDDHRVLKPIFLSLFNSTTLSSFVLPIQTVVRRHLDHWCQQSADDGFFLGYPACEQLTMDLSLEVILGKHMDDPDKDKLFVALKTFHDNLISMPVVVPGSGVWKALRAREYILQAVQEILSESKQRRDVNFHSLVELIQLNAKLAGNDQVIKDNILQLLFASYSTTSSVLCSALLCLGGNSSVLHKIEAELQEQGLLEDPSLELTYDVIGRLQYVHNVNREVLRLYPPAGASFRRTIKTLEIGGFQIPEDWLVAYSIRETQQTSDLFPNPETFLPDRWQTLNSEEFKEKVRFHYIPFGVGARACVGRKLAILIQAIFLVEVVRCCRYQLKNPSPVMKILPIAKPADDLPVIFQKRGQDTSTSSNCS